MKKILLTLGLVASIANVFAQVFAQGTYRDNFTNAPVAPATSSYWGAAAGYTSVYLAPSFNTITRTVAAGNFTSMSYSPYQNPEMSGTGAPITAVDMSGTNQDSIFIIAKASLAGATLRIDIKDANDYVANQGTVTQRYSLTTSYAVYKYVFTAPQDGAFGGSGCTTGTGPCTVNKATIKEFLVSINDGNAITSAISVDIDYIQVGGNSTTAIITSAKSAQANIASSKLYPNPVSDMAKVELELKSVSNVKVTLSDMMGKEVMTIAEGSMASVNAEVNVANLTKGVYTVNYTIDGAAAKAELLMVR